MLPRRYQARTFQNLCRSSRLHPNSNPLISPSRRVHAGQAVRAGAGSPTTNVTSSTAINAPRSALYTALEALSTPSSPSATYVNLSRLQLALRSLESNEPVIRIAILGLGSEGIKSARRAIRLVLADPLEEEATWEKELIGLGSENKPSNAEQAVLIRYGEYPELSRNNAMLATLQVTSPLLRRHNVEILVSFLNIDASSALLDDREALQQAALVPTAEMPRSFGGNIQFITFPVHKALILADGLSGLLNLGRTITPKVPYTAADAAVSTALLLDIDHWPFNAADKQNLSVIDLDKAELGLSKFRESVANSTIFEENWTKSGIQSASNFITSGLRSENAALPPAVRQLISSILYDAQQCIGDVSSQRSALDAQLTQQQLDLVRSIQEWARLSHAELRNSLDSAFSSRNWAKIKWWRLFWRVDDIAMITAEVLEQSWLVDAEKNLIWLAGHIDEAGFHAIDATKALSHHNLPQEEDHTANAANTNAQPVATVPWPSQISSARIALAASTIPAMQALAQKLVLECVTVAGTTSMLSALMFVSISTTSIFEAGTVAALGITWSLRRLQRRWEIAKETWQEELRESGRQVLKVTEDNTRQTLHSTRSVTDTEGLAEKAAAMEAVNRAKAALDIIK